MTRRASRLGRPIQHRRVGRATRRHTIPAQCPVRGASLALSLTGRLPSTASATSMTPVLFGGFLGTTHPSDSSWPCIAGCRSSELPGAVRDRCARLRTAMRPPRFRRLPFVRERVTDPGRASAPRLAVPHMLPSTVHTVSASAMFMISGLNSRPCTICCVRFARVVADTNATLTTGRPATTLPRRDLHPQESASFAWRTWTPCPAGRRPAEGKDSPQRYRGHREGGPLRRWTWDCPRRSPRSLWFFLFCAMEPMPSGHGVGDRSGIAT
jgi:hypothetical protein